MGELDIFNKMQQIEETPQFSLIFTEDSEQARKIAEHKTWLQNIRRERPNTAHGGAATLAEDSIDFVHDI